MRERGCRPARTASSSSQALALTDFRGDEHVLDVGCRDGRISARIVTDLVPRGGEGR